MNVWTNLTNETLRPLVNRAVYGIYSPGSVFKIIVGLAALEAGWNHTNIISSPGYAEVGNERKKDTAPAGDYDFKRALKLSCNKYFIDAGRWVGVDRLVAMAQQFHLGEKTSLALRPEAAGLLPTREWVRENRGAWFDGDTANLSIGQGEVAVTPLQIAVLTAAVANGGTVFWPRLVERVASAEAFDPRPPKVFEPGRVRSRLGVSARSLDILREAMLADVEDADGTGRFAAVAGFRIAAKTGTAEVKKGRATIDKMTWFASFGPYESPRYAVVVMVESGGGGGTTCGPVARKIYQAILQREKTASPAGRGQLASAE
jgi:penicillin-binding protein 2